MNIVILMAGSSQDFIDKGHFYPKYLLAKLYDETNQREKAIAVAKELLSKEVKVESTAVYEIQTEMNNILNRNIKREVECVDY